MPLIIPNSAFGSSMTCSVRLICGSLFSIINSLPIKKKFMLFYTSYLDSTSKQFWNGFGPANSNELTICFADRTPLNNVDLQLGKIMDSL